MSWLKLARRFIADTSGATGVEYATIAAVMTFMLVAVLPLFSGSVGGLFTTIVSAF